MNTIKCVWRKHRELFTYGFFGVLTTGVNFLAFLLLQRMAGGYTNAYLVNNAVAWVVAVLFAYVTNKQWVFRSSDWSLPTIGKECVGFAGTRLLSLLLEESGLWLFVEMCRFDELLSKLLLAVVVVVANYFFSKYIFKKSQKNGVGQ